MKRLVLFATAAIVALASCTKTQVVYNDAPEQITFKTVTGAMTKASVPLPLDDLGVIAHQGSNTHLDNVKFEKSGENWINENAYWPYSGTLDFTVYAPHGTASLTDEVLTISEVEAGENVYYGEQRYKDVGKTDQAVNVVLKHSSVKVTVTANLASPYTFTSMTLKGAITKGDLEVNYGANPVTVATTGTQTEEDLPLISGTAVYVLPGEQAEIEVSFTQGDISFTKSIDIEGDWEANKAYTYTITASAPDQIKISATVSDVWETGGDTSKDLATL